MKQFICIIGMLAFLNACQPPEEQEVTQSAAYSTDNLPSRWSSTAVFPIALKISNDFTQDEIDSISAAAQAWSDGVENKVTFFYSTPENLDAKSGLNNYNDSVYGVYKIYDWPDPLPGMALAVTQIEGLQYASHIQITHADILLNYDYFSFTTDGSWGYDLRTVVVHEVGHFLGLYHDNSSIEDSVMYPTISRYFDNPSPKSRDVSNLMQKYNLNQGAQNRSAIKVPTGEGVPIQMQLELYPDKEIVRINGVAKTINH